jgi:isoleucyl-tRNA synthetase
MDILYIQKNYFSIEGIADAPIYILARTTTPWTLPSNMFLAVNKNIVYSLIYDFDKKAYFVLSRKLLSSYKKEFVNFVEV